MTATNGKMLPNKMTSPKIRAVLAREKNVVICVSENLDAKPARGFAKATPVTQTAALTNMHALVVDTPYSKNMRKIMPASLLCTRTKIAGTAKAKHPQAAMIQRCLENILARHHGDDEGLEREDGDVGDEP